MIVAYVFVDTVVKWIQVENSNTVRVIVNVNTDHHFIESEGYILSGEHLFHMHLDIITCVKESDIERERILAEVNE